jgi:4-hydroxy-3-polyprenylbenzoate decarboxylase
VACYNSRRLIVISIKNLYAGHSQQAGNIAAQCHAGAYGGTYIVVVDEKVDPTNIQEVLWQILMRTEPKRAIQIVEHCWASHLTIQDPYQVQKSDKATYISKAIIDACVPLEWDPTWHGEVRINPEIRKRIQEKYGAELPPSQRRQLPGT